MAYSSGFNPHPRISYAGAAPTGSASEAEYLEIGLAEEVEPATVLRQLDEALPDGLDVLEVVDAATLVPEGSGKSSLADLLEASRWSVDTPADPAGALAAVQMFLAADSVVVERMTKKGLRSFDCRAAVASMSVVPLASGARLDLVLRHTVPAVRPDDVLTGMTRLTAFEPGSAPLLTRLQQGRLDPETGEIGDPFQISS